MVIYRTEKMVIVPVYQWLSDQVADSFLQHYPRKVITNGIDTDVFKPYDQEEMKTKFGWGGQKILLGVASSWSPRKGLADFIKLADRLPSDHRIVLVGLSGKQLQHLPANVIGVRKTESVVELAQIYSAADVVLNLSREETFGLTTVEGFACGTPGVAYNKTASPELFAVPEVGRVVQAGAIDEIADAVSALEKIGKENSITSCRNYALAHFKAQDRFAEYIDLYHRLLSRK